MDFTLTSEQQMLSDSVARFIQNDYHFEARMRRVTAGEAGVAAAWRIFAENGWLAASLPEKFGGLGGGAVDTAIIAQQFGRALVVEPWLGCAVLAAQTLAATCDDAVRSEWLPALGDGSRRLALAWSESEARGLPHIVSTRAQGSDGQIKLTGSKTLVLGGIGADAYLVSAREGGQVDSRGGIALFLVWGGAPGLTVIPALLHDGSIAATVELENVPALRIAGDGLAALESGLAHAISALCGELVGGMERATEIASEYLHTRKQFGVTIGSFQSLQHMIANMAAELELARSMLFVALASMENANPDRRRVTLSGAKALITGAARSVCGQAIQLHGGIGMTEECAVGHYFKRAMVADTLFGGRTLHERVCTVALQRELQGSVA